MSRAGDPPVRNEGRRGSRIDFDEGGGYHGTPPAELDPKIGRAHV